MLFDLTYSRLKRASKALPIIGEVGPGRECLSPALVLWHYFATFGRIPSQSVENGERDVESFRNTSLCRRR
jgi:hypothetical protein